MFKLKNIMWWAIWVGTFYLLAWLAQWLFKAEIAWQADTITILIGSVLLLIELPLVRSLIPPLSNYFQKRYPQSDRVTPIVQKYVNNGIDNLLVFAAFLTYDILHPDSFSWNFWLVIVFVIVISAAITLYQDFNKIGRQ